MATVTDDILDLTETASYDPRACGALCDRCPLGKTGKPVPPELRPDSLVTIVAESAGSTEVLLERPLVGASGRELMRALKKVGVSREQCSLTNTILCQPPGGSLKAYLAQVRKRNRDREKRGLEPFLLPTEACWPRLLRELHQSDTLLLMGAYSRSVIFKAATTEDPDDKGGGEKKLMKSRGFPTEIRIPGIDGKSPKKLDVLSTVHAAFVLRKRRWTSVFQSDVAKTIRMATDTLGYKEPRLKYDPSPEWLANFLSQAKGPFAYDVETDMYGDSIADRNLRCIGIGTSEMVTCVPWQSVERPRRHPYSPSEQEQVSRILIQWFGDKKGLVCDHNGQFDKTVMESQIPGLQVLRRRFDTCVAHHVVWSELAHDLGFLSAQMTDSPQHKDVDHDKWTSDRELHKYCMLDVATTAWCANVLAADERLKGQKNAFATDMFLSEFCRRMHVMGVQVDIFARDVWYKKLGEEAVDHMKKAQELAEAAVGKKVSHARRKFARNINPNSHHQVRDLLFSDLGLDPVPEKAGGYTDSGDPSVGKDQIFYLIDQGLPREVEDFLLAVVDYREAIKLQGTYCTVEPGIDGRIHPNWNPHVVLSGRLSCSDPNLMNVRKPLRSIYRPANGNVFVAWDKAQLEARITAWLAQDERQIQAFMDGADIHRVNACDVLGISSPDQVSKDERQFCKTFVYAVQYLASLRKAWQMVRNFVNPKSGERDYRDLTFGQAEASFNRFWKARQSIQAYHAGNRALWEKRGYIEDVIDGRRRYFLDGGGDESVKEEQANFPIQSTAAADVNRVTKRLFTGY